MTTADDPGRPPERLAERQARVLAALKAYGPMHDEQIRARLGWRINQVCPRRNELVALGMVERAGTVWNAETRRHVALWRAV